MSDDSTSSNSSAHNHSMAASPTDTRTQPRRFEPITQDHGDDDGNGESTNTPGTIRRNRPPAISTSRADIYGMFSSHSRDMLLTVSKAPWILTILQKNPLPRANRRLDRMRVTKIYKALLRWLTSKYSPPNPYHQ